MKSHHIHNGLGTEYNEKVTAYNEKKKHNK